MSSIARGMIKPPSSSYRPRGVARQKARGPKKLTIKGFKRKPKLPANFEEDAWSKLRKAVRAIHRKKPFEASREELYRTAEDMCIHKMGARLYARLQLEIEEHAARLVGELTSSLTSSSTASHFAFLAQIESTWDDFCQQTLAVRSIFLYLDRTHVLQSAGALRSIWSLAMHMLKLCLDRNPDVGRTLVNGLLSLVKGEREGEAINRSRVRNLVRMMSILGTYVSEFEAPLLNASTSFYASEGARLMHELTVPDYLRHVCDRYDQEVDRVSHYLLHSSKLALLQVLDTHLLSAHTAALIEKGFDTLADQDRIRDLKRMCGFWVRVGEAPQLARAFGAYVKRKGLEIVRDAQRDKQMVQSLLDLRARVQRILTLSFGGDAGFAIMMKEAFEFSINQRQNRPAELIAKHIDAIMRTGRVPVRSSSTRVSGKQSPSSSTSNLSASTGTNGALADGQLTNIASTAMAGDDQLEAALDITMQLFRYINGKDVFEAFYKKDLAKRLLLNKTASQDLERSMISRLKTECGADFTTKLEGMFKDMTLSHEVMDAFSRSDELRQHQKQQEANSASSLATSSSSSPSSSSSSLGALPTGAPPIETHIHVLTTGFWPTYPPSPLNLPAPLLTETNIFEEFYKAKYGGRKMQWQHSLGVVSVKANFPRGRKELSVSLFQAAVLMLFDGMGEGDKITFQEIRERTGIELGELKRTMQSLALPKVHVIRKRPKSREVLETDYFMVCHDFKDRRIRIKINQIQIKETSKEKEETHESVLRDRIHVMDAAIVRIMKTRQKLPHNQLISEIYGQLKFPSKTADLKKRIESLIDREYIERDDKTPNIYNYLA